MTGSNIATADSALDELPAKVQTGNIWRLAIAQALAGANSTVLYATGAIVGDMLAPTPMLATLPISIFVVGMAACILPAGAIARRHGRRAAFLVGTGAGVLTGLLGMLAVILGSFWLFCLATFLGGGYAAVVLTFRFAAADGGCRHRAVSPVRACTITTGQGRGGRCRFPAFGHAVWSEVVSSAGMGSARALAGRCWRCSSPGSVLWFAEGHGAKSSSSCASSRAPTVWCSPGSKVTSMPALHSTVSSSVAIETRPAMTSSTARSRTW